MHLGAEVVLLQLAALPQVPAAHCIIQAPSPQPGPIVRYVYAAGPVRVALELPVGGGQASTSTSPCASPTLPQAALHT